MGFGSRAGSLDPLPLEVGRDVRPDELSVAGVADLDLGPRDHAFGSQELDGFVVAEAAKASFTPFGHQLLLIPVESRHGFQGPEGLGGVDIRVRRL